MSSSKTDSDSALPRIVSSLNEKDETLTPAPPDPTREQRHLIVHFDVNETILVGDEAGGDTREDSLNKMLAKSAFVMYDGSDSSYSETSSFEPTHWWNGTPILDSSNDNNANHQTAEAPPLCTAWQWPTGCCPYYRTRFKGRAKTFVRHHGSAYKDLYNHMNQLLQPPPDTNLSRKSLAILSHMLPAFFETAVALSNANQHFTLVMRTMGTDLPEIAAAITAFASGQHPSYPNYSNPDLVLTPDKLLQGRWTAAGDETSHVFQLWRDETMVASGDAEILDFLHSQTGVCGIQDDYSFWKAHGFAPWAGKPVWISRNTNYHHVLMDDNIHNLVDDSIASIRVETDDQGTFRTLTGLEIIEQQGRHLIRVPTVEPILNPQWFLEQLDKAQDNFAQHYLQP